MSDPAAWPIDAIRRQFPALVRQKDGEPVVFLDGPAGSQVPKSVADAVTHYLLTTNANHGAAHATSVESDAVLDQAHAALAAFVGTSDPDEISFGANMTTITLGVSRALARHWKPGDEIILSRLDHDANVTPWVLAAEDAGVLVHHIPLRPEDWTLDLDAYHNLLSEKTRLVAVGYASNATGTVNPVREMVAAARDAGALTYIDAVHYAPHGRINVADLDCDFLACSAYKFFGPHVGILYGRRSLLEQVRPYKLRPSTDQIPGKWMTGTQNHEGIAGAAAAVRYLAALDCDGEYAHVGGDNLSIEGLAGQLDRVFARSEEHEEKLAERFLQELSSLSGVRIHGITDGDRLSQRVPTFSLTLDNVSPAAAAAYLADRGVYSWAGNHYALPFTLAAGLEPEGTLRLGALHYNTLQEIDRAIACLAEFLEQL